MRESIKKGRNRIGFSLFASDFDEVRKSVSASVQCYVIVLVAVMYFEFVVCLITVPGARNEIDIIVGSVLNEFDFQPAHSAVIGDGGAVFTIFLFCHFVTSYDFPLISMRFPSRTGLPLAQARKRILSEDSLGFGRSPSRNLSSGPTSAILKPLPTRNAENCQSFSNRPLLSNTAQISFCG